MIAYTSSLQSPISLLRSGQRGAVSWGATTCWSNPPLLLSQETTAGQLSITPSCPQLPREKRRTYHRPNTCESGRKVARCCENACAWWIPANDRTLRRHGIQLNDICLQWPYHSTIFYRKSNQSAHIFGNGKSNVYTTQRTGSRTSQGIMHFWDLQQR